MSPMMLPGPKDPNDGDNTQPGCGPPPDGDGQGKRRSKSAGIPRLEECLRALAALPGLIALRLLTTSQANAIVRVYHTILQHHPGQAGGKEQHLSDVDVLELLKKDPRLCSMLEPFLTEEQIDLIFKQSGNSSAGQS
jgi:hypothetical protein